MVVDLLSVEITIVLLVPLSLMPLCPSQDHQFLLKETAQFIVSYPFRPTCHFESA